MHLDSTLETAYVRDPILDFVFAVMIRCVRRIFIQHREHPFYELPIASTIELLFAMPTVIHDHPKRKACQS